MLNIFGVVVFHTSMVSCSVGYIYPQYMCILLYVKLIWCNSIPYIYGQLEEGFGICALCYMCNFCFVAVYHTSMVNCRGRYICPGYMCIVLSIYRSAIRCAKFGVAVLKTSMLNWGGQSAMSIYALFYIYRSSNFGVAVLKTSMLGCLGVSICHEYMCIVLYI